MNGRGELQRFLPRLRNRAGQRYDTLAEIAVGYFLDRQCGLPIIEWEPQGAYGKTGEYLVQLPDGRTVFVEVKARGWEEEIVMSEGSRSLRLLLPKYIGVETRATGRRCPTQCPPCS